jgi:hypothetical protein
MVLYILTFTFLNSGPNGSKHSPNLVCS